jgi:enediyne biosynthesis protein E3
MSSLLARLLRINLQEAAFDRRGFTCKDPAVRARLENIGRVFLGGYHAALQENDQRALAKNLDRTERELCGFAYEGAAMALALKDAISFRGNGFSRFAGGPGRQHIYMLYVGAGWAYARLPWLRRRIEASLKKQDPVLWWLVLDGYGFHQGYFHFQAQLRRNHSCLRLSPDGCHVFHQGLGRSLWFVHGADACGISATIARLPLHYHGDAWSGVGLAAAYAGGVKPEAFAQLRREAGIHVPALAQGAAFAAKARQLAGNPAEHTELACALFCQMDATDAAALCDATFRRIDLRLPCPYQQWRESIQKALSFTKEIPPRGKSHEPHTSSTLVATEPL